MNQGLYGFPTTTGIATPNIISITEYDATGTYSIPPNTASLQIVLVGGGGGGGGGGSSSNTANNSGGGGGGGGGSIVYQECLVVDDLGGQTTLRIQIGSGGAGGKGGLNSVGATALSGSPSIITIPGRPGFVMRALGGAGGIGGNTPNATGNAFGGAGRQSSINGAITTNYSGANGSWNNLATNDVGNTGTYVYLYDARSNGGAAGGTPQSNTTSNRGGSIEIPDLAVTNFPVITDIAIPIVGTTAGITAAYGGVTNGGTGADGLYMIATSMKLFGGGIGGAGGGGGNTGSTGNGGGGAGGNGYRGGGGGGGGGCRTAANNFRWGGTGGNGGNGYCCIVARA